MRTIALEEHYATPAFLDGPGHTLIQQAEAIKAHPEVAAGLTTLLDQLTDLGEGRIAAMDHAGIDVQVLSLTSPGLEQLPPEQAVPVAKKSNDTLAAAVQAHPTRFAAFAALPTAAPGEAADELQRTAEQYGFRGALINGHILGRYLDDDFFWPILERAAALNLPLYLHPAPPPNMAFYQGNYSPQTGEVLATAAWGWHLDTATHLLRIILSGALDRFPGLQLIIGHLGEGLPFMLPRLDRALHPQLTGLSRAVGDYLRDNVYYTISGFNWTPAFLDLLLTVGSERIMFSTDHPYASMAQARAFLDQLPVSPADRRRIAHGTAERLLNL